jgi:hypothetical protein
MNRVEIQSFSTSTELHDVYMWIFLSCVCVNKAGLLYVADGSMSTIVKHMSEIYMIESGE